MATVIDRKSFLGRLGTLTGAYALAGPLHALATAEAAGTSGNVLLNSLLSERAGGKGTPNKTLVPKYFTERGILMKFGDRLCAADGYRFSETGESTTTYPNATDNTKLHYDGSEGGYFQVVRVPTGATSAHAEIGIETVGPGPGRLMLYARDSSQKNIGWRAILGTPSGNLVLDYAPLPTGTVDVMFVWRGRLLSPARQIWHPHNAFLGFG